MLNLKTIILFIIAILLNSLLYAESKKTPIDTSGTLINGLPPDVFPGYWMSTSVVQSSEVLILMYLNQ